MKSPVTEGVGPGVGLLEGNPALDYSAFNRLPARLRGLAADHGQ